MADARSSSPAGSTRILVVDDDDTFRDRLARALANRGYHAYAAATPAEALALAQQVRPQRAVVDMRMPTGSGLDLVRDLCEIDESIKVIVLTGYGSIATAVDAVRLGAIHYMTKPADADEILAAFERTLERRDDPLAAAPTDAHTTGHHSTTTHSAAAATETVPSLARVEWEHIQRVLHDCNGNISRAARTLGIHRRSLQRKLNKLPPDA